MLTLFNNAYNYTASITVDYIGVDVDLWLRNHITWLLWPLIVTFLLPLTIVLLFYITGVILYVYRLHRERLINAYENNFWDGALKTVAALWDAHGWIWYGYEVNGLENVPIDSPALLIYYHGAIPIDLYYLVSRIYLIKAKLVHTVADHFLFKLPGWSIISEPLKVIPGTVKTCSDILKENNLLAISPGGVYEAQFGDRYYRLMWKKRLGFAKVAIEAKVPIIPVFTQNIREAFRCVGIGRRFWLRIYYWTRLPIVPIYGGFPVKLRTHIGKPIPYDPDLSAEELQKKVASAIEELISQHQKVPGNILRALFERVYNPLGCSKKST